MDVLAAAAAAAAPEPRPSSPVEPAYRRLSELQRWSIVALHNDGRSNRYIARHLGVHRDTVRKWLDHYAQFGDVHSGSRSGRPRCTDEASDTNMAVVARIDKFTSPRQIKRKLELECCARTIDRRLIEVGLFGRVARHKRNYSEAEVRKRLAFAEGYKDWTRKQWEKVLFSDEKCFYGKGFCGRIWVRREKGTALEPQYTVHKAAHPVKLNVWACFCANGQGYCHIFNENMDAS
jgi:transposase